MFGLAKRDLLEGPKKTLRRVVRYATRSGDDAERLPTIVFAILERCATTGREHWVGIPNPNCTSFTAASRLPSADQVYTERAAAERDAKTLRGENVRLVLATNGRHKLNTEPRTYTVVPIRIGP
jgi:hypothetical protein